MAKNKEVDVARLCEALRRDRLALRPFRENRREAVRQYIGFRWSEEGTSQPVPLNLLALYVNVVSRSLIAKNPRVMLSTFNRGARPTVRAMEKWANGEINRTRLAGTLRRCVVDGLFSLGICKVALATPAIAAASAWGVPAGAPFAERVDLDDFVFDTHARDFGEAAYLGHRLRVPLDSVRDDRLYHKSRKDLTASTDAPYNLEGDERVKQLGQQYVTGGAQEFEDMVDLWEIYLPRHRLVLTLADSHLAGAYPGGGTEPLRVQNWLGRDGGPYHLLAFGTVPGNAMPKAPIQDLVDLHEVCNELLRKMIRQAQRSKEILAVGGGAGEDGERVIKASDGEAVQVNNADQLKSVMMGQVSSPVMAVFTSLHDLFNRMAGNLDMMGGLGPQSKTATQDELLAQNASKAIADMQDTTVSFIAEVVKSQCWYWHYHPEKVMKIEHQIPGLPVMDTQGYVYPAGKGGQDDMNRGHDFEDMDIKVDPYSVLHSTPQSRLQSLNGVVTQIVIPMMQLLVQQGVAFDVNAYLKKVGEYLDMPDLAEILTIVEPPAPDTEAMGSASAGRPGSTTRNYVRENRPTSTREATDRDMVQRLMTGGTATNGKPQGEMA